MSEARLEERVWGPPWEDLREPVRRAAASTGCAVYVVGGVVRDVLLDLEPVDFDLTVVGEVGEFAEALAAETAAAVELNERFQTAELQLGDGRRVDVASARTETYESPGALPQVALSGISQDLARRDFSVNTFALGVAGDVETGLLGAEGAREDLQLRVIRVLHPASFADDPTRILRAVRLEQAAGFEMEKETCDLAGSALAEGHLEGVSGERIWREWRMLLARAEPPAAVGRLGQLGFLTALVPGLGWSQAKEGILLASIEIAGRLRTGGSEEAGRSLIEGLFLLALCGKEESLGGDIARRLSLPRDLRQMLDAWSSSLGTLPLITDSKAAPSAIHRALQDLGLAELACLAAHAGEVGAAWVRREVASFRSLELEITAADLLTAGVPQGPMIGQALEAVFDARLDERIEAGEEFDYASGVLERLETPGTERFEKP